MQDESTTGVFTPGLYADEPAIQQSISLARVLVYILGNVLLVYFANQSQLFSTLFGWSTLAIGIIFLIREKEPYKIVYLCGYLVGAELVWRSTGAGIFYEYGKYAIIFLMVLAILKYNLFERANKWSILYFLLLLPSLALLPSFNRATISFFLSGPLLLAVSTLFFSVIHFDLRQVKSLLLAVIMPTVGIGFLALYSTLTAENLYFTTESNYVTSGGFGPVQISLQLAFGAVLAFYYATLEKQDRAMVFLMAGLAIWLFSQSALTFSRSGVYNAVFTLAAYFLFFLREGRQRFRLVALIAVGLSVLYFGIFPFLDQFTGGMFTQRFLDTTTTGRDILVRGDLQAFLDHPLFGVGVGQAIRYHALMGMNTASHTEYTRLLAEHGSLGLVSLLVLVGMLLQRLFSKARFRGKSLSMLWTAWGALYMLHTTMRTAAVGFTFGLGGAIFMLDDEAPGAARDLGDVDE